MENIVIEYNNALLVNNQRIPFVLEDSVKVDRKNMTVTLTIAFSEYRRIAINKEPVEKYEFKD